MIEGLIVLAVLILTLLVGIALIVFGRWVFGAILICVFIAFVLSAWLTPPHKE